MAKAAASGDPHDASADESSSDDDDLRDHVLYAQRREWSDLKPLEQDDTERTVLKMAYTPHYADALGYFRAIVAVKEMSQRALDVTSSVIRFSPANYTAWYYRKLLTQHLQTSKTSELDFLDSITLKHPKNYQVWNYRQWLIESMESPPDTILKRERHFLDAIYSLDTKNYHAWTYRQWLATRFKSWPEELDFADKCIGSDIFNNSAWNHRFFIVHASTGFPAPILRREMDYTSSMLSIDSLNESAWNYLWGILHHDKGKHSEELDEMLKFAQSLFERGAASYLLLGFMLDCLEEKADARNLDKIGFETAQSLCDELVQTDPIRQRYWEYRRTLMQSKSAAVSS